MKSKNLTNQQNHQEEKDIYELSFFLAPQLTDNETNTILNEMQELIKKEGEIIYVEPFQLRKLAYPIKKMNEGYFGFLQFKYFKEKISDIKNLIDKNPNVLRYLLIRLDPKEDIIYIPETEEKKTVSFKKIKELKPQEAISKKREEEKEISLEELEKKLEEILKQ